LGEDEREKERVGMGGDFIATSVIWTGGSHVRYDARARRSEKEARSFTCT
jgi:hypothetical protein